jgi:hypothetical protein
MPDAKQLERDLSLCCSEVKRRTLVEGKSAVGILDKSLESDDSSDVFESAMDEQVEELNKFLSTVELSDLFIKDNDEGMQGFGVVEGPSEGDVEEGEDEIQEVYSKLTPPYERYWYLQ